MKVPINIHAKSQVDRSTHNKNLSKEESSTAADPGLF